VGLRSLARTSYPVLGLGPCLVLPEACPGGLDLEGCLGRGVRAMSRLRYSGEMEARRARSVATPDHNGGSQNASLCYHAHVLDLGVDRGLVLVLALGHGHGLDLDLALYPDRVDQYVEANGLWTRVMCTMVGLKGVHSLEES
jgi:hypothetical protein